MKILLVNRTLPVHVAGGLERHVEDLALGLAAAGVDLHLLTAPVPATEAARWAALGVRLHGLPAGDPRRYTMRWLAGAGPRIEALHSLHRYDAIHAQEFALGLWRPRWGRYPLILSAHGTITSETPLHSDCRVMLSPRERLWAWRRFGRRILFQPHWLRHLRSARRILVDSAFTRAELDRLVPDCRGLIHTVPLAVREAAPEPVDRSAVRRALGWTVPTLLTVGRLEWQKGQDLALEALAGLRELDWRYVIAGEGSARPALERRIAQDQLGGRVELAGRVSEADKARMLAAADLFLWPERTHPAFGLAGLEAMQQGTPVLATPRGAIPEVLGRRGGWLTGDCTAAAVREALLPLLRDPERLDAMRPGLRQDALNRFDFGRMIDTMLFHYETVAGG